MNLAPIRPEVIEARRSRKAGAIVLARPVPLKIAGGCALVIILAFALLLTFGEYSSKVKATGQLAYAGGAIKVVAPQNGRITVRHIQEGDRVKAGQVLFELSAERMGNDGSIDKRIVASLNSRREQIIQQREASLQQLALRQVALKDQRRLARTELATHNGSIAIQNEIVRSARATLLRQHTLAQQGFVAHAVLDQYNNALHVELAKRNALAVNLNSARSSLLQVEDELATTASKENEVRAQAQQALAQVDQEIAEHEGRSTLRLTAPTSGTITALAYETGQTVSTGAPLATVLPNGSQLEARLLIPSQAKSSVAIGQQVYLRIDAFPYQKYGLVSGTIKEVELHPINDTGGPASPVLSPLNEGPVNPPVYRTTVRLSTDHMMMYGKRKDFEPGLTLEADIYNDRRMLIEWIIDPLVSTAKGLNPPQPTKPR